VAHCIGQIFKSHPLQAPRVREAREKRQSDIKRAAIEEFARHGFRGASTRSIAERAGLSKSRLHYYIDSKEDLYREVLLDTMQAWGTLFDFQAEDKGPETVLADYIRKKLEFSFSDPLRTKIFTAEILAGAPEFAAQMSGEIGDAPNYVRAAPPAPLSRNPSHNFPAPSSTSFMSLRSCADSSACLLIAECAESASITAFMIS